MLPLACSHLFEYLNKDLRTKSNDYTKARKIYCDTKSPSISSIFINPKKGCVSVAHQVKDIKMTSSNRSISSNSLGIDKLALNKEKIIIQFSDPILLYTSNSSGEKTVIFDNAEKYDERILMENGQRSLNAEIVEFLSLEELINIYTDKKIPCKYIMFDIIGIDETILVEMNDDKGCCSCG